MTSNHASFGSPIGGNGPLSGGHPAGMSTRHPTGDPARILIIDDDDITSELVSRALRKSAPHLRVEAAEDGAQGLAVLRDNARGKPNVILLDINMPRMNGFEFLEEMRADPALRNNVVFMFSTSEAERDRDRAYALGVAGYIGKARAGLHLCKLSDLLQSYSAAVIPPR